VDSAFTIEASPTMRLHLGCKRVILGRSERQHKLAMQNMFIN